jgi:hypothetical protein
MVRPYLKELGLSKDKIYYLLHTEDQKERVRNRKFKPIYNKNDPVKTSKTVGDSPKSKVLHYEDISSKAQAELQSATEEQEVEFDLIQALHAGLKDAIKKAENAKSQVWIVKIHMKNGVVERIENMAEVYEGSNS